MVGVVKTPPPRWQAVRGKLYQRIAATPAAARAALLVTESCVTAVPFVLSWFACAIYFAVKAGYLMAAAESADKCKLLEQMWGGERP